MKKFDDINNPSHYTQGRTIQPIDAITDWGLNFNLGNTVKYISRAGRKDDILKDLKKAKFYLDYEINRLENVTPEDIKKENLTATINDGKCKLNKESKDE